MRMADCPVPFAYPVQLSLEEVVQPIQVEISTPGSIDVLFGEDVNVNASSTKVFGLSSSLGVPVTGLSQFGADTIRVSYNAAGPVPGVLLHSGRGSQAMGQTDDLRRVAVFTLPIPFV